MINPIVSKTARAYEAKGRRFTKQLAAADAGHHLSNFPEKHQDKDRRKDEYKGAAKWEERRRVRLQDSRGQKTEVKGTQMQRDPAIRCSSC